MVWGGNDNAVQKWIKQLQENDPSLKTLHILSMRRLSQSDFQSIFGALAHNTTLKELYCSGHELDIETMEQLSEALTLNDTLSSLNIGTSTLGENKQLVSILCEGLAVNEGLRHLDLENKGLDNDAIALLADSLIKNETLRSLNLSRNKITDDIIEKLNESIRGLEKLHLADNAIGAQGARTLQLHQLQELDLSNNPLMEGASDLAATLQDNHHLTLLKLVNITTKQEEQQQDTPTPACSEHGNALVYQLATVMKSNRTLTHLWIDQNGIESSAVELKDLCKGNLIELRMRDNKIDDQGAASLADGIQSNNTLEHLDLGTNIIGYEGFGALLNTSIRHLGLFNNNVNGFPESLPGLEQSGVETLDIGCNNISITDLEGIVQVLAQQGVPRLRLLEMGGNAKEQDMDAWESAVAKLQEARAEIQVAWKRFMEQQQ
ncbi:RNI-like protein [Lichtheimia hyalospora FSU 10163]|nr:RNI-like protein [Lichtheimia hyalospora FSU 10163]